MNVQSNFPVITSTANLNNAEYKANLEAWKPVLEQFEANLQAVISEGTEQSCKRHQQRGQLLPRDRIALLLDQGSPFLELGPFTGFELPESTICGNIIAGIGNVCGRPCLILSHIPTASGGAWNEYTVLKQNRVTEIASENDLPIIGLVQSAGVFLPYQFRTFHIGGQIFRDLSIRSDKGKPSCAIVFGASTAGGAYHPALSDYSIFVEKQAQVCLAGPPLVKMATGEVVDAETLGGAEMHATVTGLADQIAVDEFDAIKKAREWITTLSPPVPRPTTVVLPPRYPAEDLLALVNPDIRKTFDMMEVILRIVDDSRLSIMKPTYGKNLITAWAKISGTTVGIIANQTPVIYSEEAAKGTQFIRMCNQQNCPIIYLHNVSGFMVGVKAEHSGIIKRGAQFVSAVSVSKVPQISVVIGASYGAGNYAMCGRSFRPRFLFTWPTGRVGVMGPQQVAGVMQQVQVASAKSHGVTLKPEEIKKRVQKFHDEVDRDESCYKTSAALHDDGVIDPRDTRDVLSICLEVCTLPGVKGSDSHQALARM